MNISETKLSEIQKEHDETLKSLQAEKKKVLEKEHAIAAKNKQIESMMMKLDDYNKTQREKENLEREFQTLSDMAQEDLTVQKEQMEMMTKEIMMLASRNNTLETER